jgi:uncharacterized protein (TIGR00290 family)
MGGSRIRVVLSWSGGKDSALALSCLRKDEDMVVSSLLVTITEEYDRVSMHGIRRELIVEQARALEIPLIIVKIPMGCINEDYEKRMEEATLKLKDDGVMTVAFGDIYLNDVRRYREANLAKVGMSALFPLWGLDTRPLASEFVKDFKAIVTCVDTEQLDGGFSGRLLDESFLADLPQNVDHCGENGEFHTFVFDGPIFDRPVSYRAGERVLRENRFMFTDVLPL